MVRCLGPQRLGNVRVNIPGPVSKSGGRRWNVLITDLACRGDGALGLCAAPALSLEGYFYKSAAIWGYLAYWHRSARGCRVIPTGEYAMVGSRDGGQTKVLRARAVPAPGPGPGYRERPLFKCPSSNACWRLKICARVLSDLVIRGLDVE